LSQLPALPPVPGAPDSVRRGEAQYIEVNQRPSAVTGIGASCITLLTIIAIWGQKRRVGIVLAIQVLVIAFNVTH
jgi:hypothetical protein